MTLRERRSRGKNGQLGSIRTEAKIPTAQGLVRLSGPAARVAVAEAVDEAPLVAVASQTKDRRLLLVGGRFLAPDFVVALDDAQVQVGDRRSERKEIETQIFTSLLWTKAVDLARVDRFLRFTTALESRYGLSRNQASGYSAIELPS